MRRLALVVALVVVAPLVAACASGSQKTLNFARSLLFGGVNVTRRLVSSLTAATISVGAGGPSTSMSIGSLIESTASPVVASTRK